MRLLLSFIRDKALAPGGMCSSFRYMRCCMAYCSVPRPVQTPLLASFRSRCQLVRMRAHGNTALGRLASARPGSAAAQTERGGA
uniref:Uncharacterized protein n=1 Tax=Haemaphysalis qinghaiensis TaxID=297592 RepID=A5Z1E0_9ACAR|nr:unknown [Haemaphysalis qinghaiensis]